MTTITGVYFPYKTMRLLIYVVSLSSGSGIWRYPVASISLGYVYNNRHSEVASVLDICDGSRSRHVNDA